MGCTIGNHPPVSVCEKCPDKDHCPADVEDFSTWEVDLVDTREDR